MKNKIINILKNIKYLIFGNLLLSTFYFPYIFFISFSQRQHLHGIDVSYDYIIIICIISFYILSIFLVVLFYKYLIKYTHLLILPAIFITFPLIIAILLKKLNRVLFVYSCGHHWEHEIEYLIFGYVIPLFIITSTISLIVIIKQKIKIRKNNTN